MAKPTALILGGAGAIGFAIGDVLGDNGIDSVVIDTRRPPSGDRRFIQADLRVGADVERVLAELHSIAIDVSLIVNAVGVFSARDDYGFDVDDLEGAFRSNVVGPLSFISQWIATFGLIENSVVVNVSSASAIRASRDPSYAISKAGLNAATRCMARALAPSEVWVFGVAPGLVNSAMAAAMTSDRRHRLASLSMLGREVQPREIAKLTVGLALSAPQLISGTTIDASGGFFV